MNRDYMDPLYPPDAARMRRGLIRALGFLLTAIPELIKDAEEAQLRGELTEKEQIAILCQTLQSRHRYAIKTILTGYFGDEWKRWFREVGYSTFED